MNKTESFEIEPNEETWAMRREGRGLVATGRQASCRCSRCRLYRWYPPLMAVSTVMTAVFCFLYLTKPVFLEAPVMKVREGGDKIPPGYMIAEDETGRTSPAAVPASTMPSELDPGLLSLPAETPVVDPVVAALSQPEPIDILDVPPAVVAAEEAPVEKKPVIEPFVLAPPEPMPVRVTVGSRMESFDPVLAGGFQPLQVRKADRPLFQSLTKADLARLEGRKTAKEVPALEESELPEVPVVAEDDGLDPPAALVIDGTGVEREVAPAGVLSGDGPDEGAGEKPVMRASLIGEFYQDDEENGGEAEMLHETAMR